SNPHKLGLVNLETGKNTILHASPNILYWPARHGSALCVPWRAKGQVGVDWVDERGHCFRNAAWRHTGVRSTNLHATQAGLALQTNDQTIWWLGEEDRPLWKIRAKPYIYQVHAYPGSDVFVATDGNGGHLFCFDPVSGRQTLDLKPALGGVGHLTKVPGHDVLVSSFAVSRSYSTPARLLVFSIKDRSYDLEN